MPWIKPSRRAATLVRTSQGRTAWFMCGPANAAGQHANGAGAGQGPTTPTLHAGQGVERDGGRGARGTWPTGVAAPPAASLCLRESPEHSQACGAAEAARQCRGRRGARVPTEHRGPHLAAGTA